MIRILWPTIRPAMMQATYAHWLKTAIDPEMVRVTVAVNTKEELDQFEPGAIYDSIVVGTRRRGACYAVYKLGQMIQGSPRDIIILASDDFYPDQGWDTAIEKALEEWDGALLVADGYQEFRDGGVMTIPIMAYGCLLKLNRILNHPLYHCWAADKELYDNLNEIGLIKNVRADVKDGQGKITIEHRHWLNGKRAKDKHDLYAESMNKRDLTTYRRRKQMTLRQRLAPLPEGV